MRYRESGKELIVLAAVGAGVRETVQDASEVFWEVVCSGCLVGAEGEVVSAGVVWVGGGAGGVGAGGVWLRWCWRGGGGGRVGGHGWVGLG